MIIFEMEMPNGAIAKFHRIAKWEMTPDSTHAVVNSYASPTMELISWQDTYTIPLEFPIQTIHDIEFILTQPLAPMAGGSIVPDTVDTLTSAQARKWAMVKVERDRRINGTFETSLGSIQIDDRSVLALATARRILVDDEGTVAWTMADNTSATLASADIAAILNEVAQYQTEVHAASQAKRTAIYAAETIEDVAAVDTSSWPVRPIGE